MQSKGKQDPDYRDNQRGDKPRRSQSGSLLDSVVAKWCANDTKFEKPLRVIFLSFLALTVCILILQNIVSEYRNLRAPQDAVVKTTERLLMQQKAIGAETLDEILHAISANTELQSAIRQKDQAKIKEIADSHFALKFDSLNVVELAIYTADQKLIYPAEPVSSTNAGGEAFTADVNAILLGRTNGVEFGPNDQFVVSVLRPWVSDGRLLGYLKLAIDIERSLALASTAVDAQIVKICHETGQSKDTGGTTSYRVLGNLAPTGLNPEVFALSGEDAQKIKPVYLRDGKIFMVRDLPIPIAPKDEEFKLLLVKDVTANVRAFLEGVLVSILAGVGLSLIAWAVLYRLLSRLQLSVQMTHSRLEAEVLDYMDKLERNATKLLEAQRIASVGSWERDVVSDKIEATEEYFRIMNVPPDTAPEDIEKRVFAQIPEDELTYANLIVQQAIETCGTFDFEHSLVPEDSAPRSLHVRGYVVAGSDGSGSKIVGTVHDITDRTRAEQRNNLLANILESSLNEIYILEAETFRIEHANTCALNNLGYEIDEIKTLRLWDINPDYNEEAAWQRVDPLRQGDLESVTAECLHRRKNGAEYPVDLRIQLLNDKDKSLFIIFANDVTDRVLRETETREAQIRAERLAYFDPLTKLSNRAACQRDAKKRFAQKDKPAFLVHVDMDNFKRVNDSLGHLAGDYCLEETGRRLREVARGLGTPYRWGGDEFVILAENSGSDPNELCARARHVMRKPMEFRGNRFWPTVSMGVALCPKDGSDFEELLVNADLALYQSKEHGKDRSTFFKSTMKTESETEARVERELQSAVTNDQFFMVFQPQVNLRSQAVTGIEALIRWDHPGRGILSPGDFLPVVERAGLAPVVGEIIIDRALAAAKFWLDRGFDFGRVCVNVSPAHLASGLLVDHFSNAMAKHGVEPNRITAEVLESVFLNDNRSGHLAALRELFNLGVHIELDDFGTGYASLTHVADLPINGLKIDRSFTNQIIDDPRKEAVVNQLIHLARSLNISVVCEGVETEAQYDRLRMMGDFSIQGYLIAEPMPLEVMANWMRENSDDLYFVV